MAIRRSQQRSLSICEGPNRENVYIYGGNNHYTATTASSKTIPCHDRSFGSHTNPRLSLYNKHISQPRLSSNKLGSSDLIPSAPIPQHLAPPLGTSDNVACMRAGLGIHMLYHPSARHAAVRGVGIAWPCCRGISKLSCHALRCELRMFLRFGMVLACGDVLASLGCAVVTLVMLT